MFLFTEGKLEAFTTVDRTKHISNCSMEASQYTRNDFSENQFSKEQVSETSQILDVDKISRASTLSRASNRGAFINYVARILDIFDPGVIHKGGGFLKKNHNRKLGCLVTMVSFMQFLDSLRHSKWGFINRPE